MQFCLLVNGMKPSDPSVDPHAVKILREMSELAKDCGAQLLLYPHQGSWIERIEDSVRVAEKVDRANVGVMFNLCHWLRVDKSRDYKPLLQQALPRLWAVSINGADNFDGKPGWMKPVFIMYEAGPWTLDLLAMAMKNAISSTSFACSGNTSLTQRPD